ncbi:hypothetical protein AcV7_005470 [Taiwanofungus camphoratus]|nr:hypothetical protein AcV7_005470 [Antrodia cinnamomea]
MTWRISGYFMSFSTARALATRLGIQVDRSTNPEQDELRMEHPFNGWLFETQRLHMKAAVVDHPRDAGEMGFALFTSFIEFDGADPGKTEEGNNDRSVKRWLEENQVPVSELEWVSMVDTMNITLGGIQPSPETVIFIWTPIEEMVKSVKEDCARIRRHREEAGLA